ncbi:hypothetical protein GW643_10345 [Serratia marcescens]|uniref:hypothetical protein n=1 Tax=Serratia marcescens TaxID=615 RepID=UPI0013788101|nr:hypothetical protein [Serratia marcescens]NCJ10790.1 hypothetical protein [Serratia marcescens]NDJ01011.1 hypothetical protein [Serratia marcescens]
MSSDNPFSLKLLQAINDWQIKTTTSRGKRLKELSAKLPKEFRECKHVCYRKLELEKSGVFSLVAKSMLKEKISSWSPSVDVVKKFKFGVSLDIENELSFIIRYKPKSSEVILNLEAVYGNELFNSAVNQHESSIKNISKGIRAYGNSQKEVILEIGHVDQLNIYMIGGCSSPVSMVYAPQVFPRLQDGDTVAVYKDYKYFCIFKWVEPERTGIALARTLQRLGVTIPYNVFSKKYGLDYGTQH